MAVETLNAQEKISSPEVGIRPETFETQKSVQEVATDAIMEINHEVAMVKDSEEELAGIDNSVKVADVSAKEKIEDELKAKETLHEIDQEIETIKEKAIQEIVSEVPTEKADLAVRDFSKQYHHPDYRSSVAKSILEARKEGKSGEEAKNAFYEKTESEKENFESQEKERSVAEIMKEKDTVFLHGIPLYKNENRGSDFNNRVANNSKLSFQDSYEMIAGLDPTISVFIPSADRPSGGMYKRQGVILGGGEVLSAKAKDSGSEAFGLTKRIPKYDNEDHKHSAIQPTIDIDSITGAEELSLRDALYNEVTVEKPKIAGMYYDLSMDANQYDVSNPTWKATFGDVSPEELQKGIDEWKQKDLENQNKEMILMIENSQKAGVPLYAFKNQNGAIEKYRVDFGEGKHSEKYNKLIEMGFTEDMVPEEDRALEYAYQLVPVHAEDILNAQKEIPAADKLVMIKDIEEKVKFSDSAQKDIAQKIKTLQ